MLNAKGISVRYGERMVLDRVDLSLEEGQWMMLCGPNGAGKSTLLKALAQMLPYTGTVHLLGENAAKMKATRFARIVGVLAQKNYVGYAFTVEEVVRMGRYAHHRWFGGDTQTDEQAITDALEETGLLQMRNRSLLALSGGEMQRVFLAQVLSQQPRILMLDEPGNHLDLQYQRQFFEMIAAWVRQPGRAVISVVHELSQAKRYGTHALLLDHGKCIAQGETEKVLNRESLQAVYGIDVYLYMAQLLRVWEPVRPDCDFQRNVAQKVDNS